MGAFTLKSVLFTRLTTMYVCFCQIDVVTNVCWVSNELANLAF